MSVIKEIDQLIQINRNQKQAERSSQQVSANIGTASRERSFVEAKPPRDTSVKKAPTSEQRKRSKSAADKQRQAKIQKLKQKKNRYKSKLIQIRKTSNAQDAEIQRLSIIIGSLQQQISQERGATQRTTSEFEQTQLELTRQAEEITNIRSVLEQKENTIKDLNFQLSESRDAYLNLKQLSTDLKIDKKALESDITEKIKSLAAADKEIDHLNQLNA